MKLRKVLCALTAALTLLSSMAIPARAENSGFTAEAKTSEPTYNITDDTDTTNGSVSILVNGVPATKAAKGDTVTIIAAPNDGYISHSIMVGGDEDGGWGGLLEIIDNKFEFTMPGADRFFRVYFVEGEKPTYGITCLFNDSIGSISILVNGVPATNAAEGDTVALIVTPRHGYKVDRFRLLGNGGGDDIPGNEFEFIMPGEDVRIGLTFVEDENATFNITDETDTTNGSVSILVNGVPATKAAAFDTVTVIATPNPGYRVGAFGYGTERRDSFDYEPSGNVFDFVMWNQDMWVNVDFVKDEKPTYNIIDYTDTTNGSVTVLVNGVPATKAAEGDIVTIIASPNPGYRAIGITASDGESAGSVEIYDNKEELIMPGSEIRFSVRFVKDEKPTYNIINVSDITKGSVSFMVNGVAVTKAAAGDIVTVIIEPNNSNGYYSYVAPIIKTADGTVLTPVFGDAFGISAFTMPEGAVTVEVTFAEGAMGWGDPEEYEIKKGTITNGTVSILVNGVPATKAAAGDTVTVIVTPNPGYKVDSFNYYTGNRGVTAGWSANEYEFEMPEGDVTVNVSFVKNEKPMGGYTPAYEIKKGTVTNGSVSFLVNNMRRTLAEPGESVLIVAVPDSGYKVDTITVRKANGSAVSVRRNEFVMPEDDVTVNVTFRVDTGKDEKFNIINASDTTKGSVSFIVNGVAATKAAAGDIVTVVAEPNYSNGYYAWSGPTVKMADGSAVTVFFESGDKFIMPEGAVTVEVLFLEGAMGGWTDYEIKKGTITNGSVSFEGDYLWFEADGKKRTYADPGGVVEVVAVPNSGYKVDTITVRKADGSAVSVRGNKFIMPGDDVTVNVVFTKVESSGSSGSSSSSGSSGGSGSSGSSGGSGSSGSTSTSFDIVSAIGSANEGGTVKVNGTVSISADVLKSAGDKNIRFEVKVDSTFTWNIDTNKVTNTHIPLTLNVDPASVDTVQTAKIKRSSAAVDRNEMSFTTSAANLGSGAALNVKTSVKPAANAPQFANLYKTKADGTLEFASAAPIDANGNAVLPIADAGTYTIVTSTETKLVGDVDNNCQVSIADVSATLNHFVNSSGAGNFKLDFNNDDQFTITDVAALLRYFVNGCK